MKLKDAAKEYYTESVDQDGEGVATCYNSNEDHFILIDNRVLTFLQDDGEEDGWFYIDGDGRDGYIKSDTNVNVYAKIH